MAHSRISYLLIAGALLCSSCSKLGLDAKKPEIPGPGGGGGGPGGSSLFTKIWDFSVSTDYVFDPLKVDVSGGQAKLKSFDQTDDDFSVTGFNGGTLKHLDWNSTSHALSLSTASPVNDWEIHSSWIDETGLKGHWKLNGTLGSVSDGATFADETGASQATAKNPNSAGMSVATGKLHESVALDGVDDYLQAAPTAPWDTSKYTVSLWIKPAVLGQATGPSAFSNFKNFGGVAGSDSLDIGVDSGNPGSYRINNSVINVKFGKVTTNWAHIVITYDGVLGIYLNGYRYLYRRLAANRAGTFFRDYLVGVNSLGNHFFNGSVDELAVWDRALSRTEVESLHFFQKAKRSGEILSRVMDSEIALPWSDWKIKTEQPLYKELPSQGQSETLANYPGLTNDLMLGNRLLYRFNESGPLGVISDDSSFHQDATCAGTTCPIAQLRGVFKTAFHFDGVDDAIATPWDGVSGNGARTVALWARFLSNADQPLLSWGDDTIAGGSYQLRVNSNAAQGVLGALVTDIGGNRRVVGTKPLFDGEWHHIVSVFPVGGANASDVIHYIDGVLDASSGISDGVLSTETTTVNAKKVMIGSRFDSGVQSSFDGEIDEVAGFDRALSTQEIKGLNARGSERMLVQLRSCDDSACSGESFIGNEGSGASSSAYYSEILNSTPNGLSLSALTELGSNRYFQYRTLLFSDQLTGSPGVLSAEAGPIHYSSSSPSVQISVPISYLSLSGSGFAATEGGSCSVKYQMIALSNPWFWNGSGWALASSSADSNTQAELSATLDVISPAILGSSLISIRAYLVSDGLQDCFLQSVQLEGTH